MDTTFNALLTHAQDLASISCGIWFPQYCGPHAPKDLGKFQLVGIICFRVVPARHGGAQINE
jgi:hypothetical protein